MTFSKINPSGWSVNDELLSTQMNSLDTNQAKAIDKTGETSASGGGVSGEIDIKSGASVVIQSGAALTADAGSTVTASGTVNVNSGAVVDIKSGATFQIDSGATGTISNTTNLASGSNLVVQSGGRILSQSSGIVTIGSIFNILPTSIAAATSTYTIGGADTVLLIDTSTTAKTITLPAVTATGRVLFFNDTAYAAATHNVAITTGGSGSIYYQGAPFTTYTLSTSGFHCSLISDGANWYFVTYVTGI